MYRNEILFIVSVMQFYVERKYLNFGEACMSKLGGVRYYIFVFLKMK